MELIETGSQQWSSQSILFIGYDAMAVDLEINTPSKVSLRILKSVIADGAKEDASFKDSARISILSNHLGNSATYSIRKDWKGMVHSGSRKQKMNLNSEQFELLLRHSSRSSSCVRPELPQKDWVEESERGSFSNPDHI